MENNLFDFGMIGLGTMGRNLLLNMADHGFKAIGFDLDPGKAKLLESSASAGYRGKGSEFSGRDGKTAADSPKNHDAGTGRKARRRCDPAPFCLSFHLETLS